MDKFLKNDILSLRAPEPEDLDMLYLWENDTDVWKYGAAISPYSKYVLKQYIVNAQIDIFQSKQLRFMIQLVETEAVVGTIDLYDFDALNSRCGVGIYIDSAWRKKGYALSALSLLQHYVFKYLKVNQLYAIIPRSNIPSLQLFQSSGFTDSGILKQWISSSDVYEDATIVQRISTSQL